MPVFDGLSKREREILTIVYRKGETSAREVQNELNDGTSYSAVRTFLSMLEAKRHLTHRLEGQRYLWSPAADPEREGASLIAETARTFFKGSRSRAIAALIETDDTPLTDEEYARLTELIERARRKGV